MRARIFLAIIIRSLSSNVVMIDKFVLSAATVGGHPVRGSSTMFAQPSLNFVTLYTSTIHNKSSTRFFQRSMNLFFFTAQCFDANIRMHTCRS